MFGFKNFFKVGSGIQVMYQVGGNTNILSNRKSGLIRKVGIGKGGAYVRMTYRCGKTGANRIATLSIAKMVHPIVFSN